MVGRVGPNRVRCGHGWRGQVTAFLKVLSMILARDRLGTAADEAAQVPGWIDGRIMNDVRKVYSSIRGEIMLVTWFLRGK